MKRLACAVGAFLLVGCGYTSAGDGTGTLLVVARGSLVAGAGNRMQLQVDVSRDGADVEDAVVRLTDPEDDASVVLAYQNGGRYTGQLTGYHRRLALEVQSGSDALSARLEGPGPHVLTRPQAGERYTLGSLGGGLDVRWRVDDGLRADTVRVELDGAGYETELDLDEGKWTVPVNRLQTGSEEVRVARSNSVVLAGGVSGSSFEITYEVRNAFDIDP